jgi:hypothetical protein
LASQTPAQPLSKNQQALQVLGLPIGPSTSNQYQGYAAVEAEVGSYIAVPVVQDMDSLTFWQVWKLFYINPDNLIL